MDPSKWLGSQRHCAGIVRRVTKHTQQFNTWQECAPCAFRKHISFTAYCFAFLKEESSSRYTFYMMDVLILSVCFISDLNQHCRPVCKKKKHVLSTDPGRLLSPEHSWHRDQLCKGYTWIYHFCSICESSFMNYVNNVLHHQLIDRTWNSLGQKKLFFIGWKLTSLIIIDNLPRQHAVFTNLYTYTTRCPSAAFGRNSLHRNHHWLCLAPSGERGEWFPDRITWQTPYLYWVTTCNN